MSFGKIIADMPCWYKVVGVIFCLFHAIRDSMEKYAVEKLSRLSNVPPPTSAGGPGNPMANLSKLEKIWVWYIHDFFFKIIVVASSFIALYVANMLLSSVTSFDNIGTGTATLVIFLFIWGILGISGYLTALIQSGKIFPGMK